MNNIKVELQGVFGNDRQIAESAWTSSFDYEKKKQRTEDDVARVVNMLADSKHSVPFESVVFRFWIRMPISTDRQHMTHRIASHSGLSGRYRTVPTEWSDLPEDVLTIIKKIYKDEALTDLFVSGLRYDYGRLCEEANTFYKNSVETFKYAEKGGKITNSEFKRLREKFRDVLPQGNITERVSVINLRSFANYIKLRNSEHAQPEIRRVAQLMLEAVKNSNTCSVALEALERNGWNI